MVIGQQTLLRKVYQFVVTLGVVPHLADTVGVPLSTRSVHSNLISSLVTPDEMELESNIKKLLLVIQPTNVSKLLMILYIYDILMKFRKQEFPGNQYETPETH